MTADGSAHRPRKRFGQHFLHDERVLERMVAALALRRDDRVIEIGPGEGALTAHLAPEVDRLVAVEIDRDLVAALHERFPAVEVISADVLRVDLLGLLAGTDAWRIVGNLPYNISTPLLGRLLDVTPHLCDMHFLLQKEVVDRMAAEPGTKAWGRLSVMVQWRLQVEPLFGVAPGSFRPPPKVHSTFVRLRPKPVDASVDAAVLARVVALAFQQRRKRLSNALQSLAIDWSRAPVDPGLRADAVDLAGYVALARFLAAPSRAPGEGE